MRLYLHYGIHMDVVKRPPKLTARTLLQRLGRTLSAVYSGGGLTNARSLWSGTYSQRI
jgi:hypothetical protein